MANITLCSFILLFCSLTVFADENLKIQRILEELSELRTRVDKQDLELHQLKQVVKSQSMEIQLLKGVRLTDDVSPELESNSADKAHETVSSQKSTELLNASANLTRRILRKDRSSGFVTLSPGSVQMTRRIGLTSYRDSNDPVVPRETLIFNHVLTNTGNRYNHYTGVFSADQDGLYVFYFGLECKGAKIQAEIVNDNAAFGFVYCDATSGGYHNSGEMVVREISSGTSVWVRVVSSSDHNKNTLGDKTIFTGFLLY